LEETLQALGEQVGKGTIRRAGCCNVNAGQLRSAIDVSDRLGLARFEVLQTMYNVVASRRLVDRLLALTRAEKIGVIGYSPLGGGFLTGKYTSNPTKIAPGTHFHVIPGHIDLYFTPGNFGIVERLREKSAATGVPITRLAVGWALRNPDVPCVLVGARSVEQIENAIAALEMDFPEEWMAEMNAWSQRGTAIEGTLDASE
jgi:aryl-alcohol dehydrogenase-like predicted oxidoreductase